MRQPDFSILSNFNTDEEFREIHCKLLRNRGNPTSKINTASTANMEQQQYMTTDQTVTVEKPTYNMIIHYTHEQRLAEYTKAVHQVWHNTFTHTPMDSTRLIVATRNNKNNTRELLQNNPQKQRDKTKNNTKIAPR